MLLTEELAWRGLLQDISNLKGIDELCRTAPPPVYIGFDPTAPCLHIGNLLQLILLRRAQKLGHTPILLVGGGTGLIGDPSGKQSERTLSSKDQVNQWSEKIRKQAEGYLDFSHVPTKPIVANNADWIQPLSAVELLRDIGKHFPLSMMLNKESVNARLGGEGISFTEFSYMLLQAYDFVELNKRHGCRMQLGGSDQWGNITAGIQLGRKLQLEEFFGITSPLIVDEKGKKFGKTEAGTVWLDPSMTSPYSFYQFWFNISDELAIKALHYFSALQHEEITALQQAHELASHERPIQKQIACEMTELVHGKDELKNAILISNAWFNQSLEQLQNDHFEQIASHLPVFEAKALSENLSQVLTECALTASNSEALRLLKSGGIKVNNSGHKSNSLLGDLPKLHNKWVLLSRGKKKNALIRYA